MCSEFLEDMMEAVGFPEKFIKLVMVCVTNTSITLMLNGSPTGFFSVKEKIKTRGPYISSSFCPLHGVFHQDYVLH